MWQFIMCGKHVLQMWIIRVEIMFTTLRKFAAENIVE